MSWYPHVTVATVVEKDGRQLVVEETSGNRTVINQPAGHLDPDETLIEAAVRETLEETGWPVRPTAILGVHLYTSPHNNVTYHRTPFTAEAIEHDPERPLDDGIIQARWLSYEELLENRERLRSPMVLQDVEIHRSGQRLSLEMLHHHT